MFRRSLAICAVFVFSSASVLLGGATDYFGNAGALPYTSEDGSFQVRLGVTLYPEGIVRAFDAPERPAMPVLLETTRVVPEQKFGIYVVFSGCEEGADGNCDTTAVYEIELPDGTLSVRRENIPVWQQPAPGPDMPQISKGVWVTSAEVSDPPGERVIRAIVTDHVANKTIVLERTLVLEQQPGQVSRARP